jgi:hypothetical protein
LTELLHDQESTENQAATMQPRIKQKLISHHKTTQPLAKNHQAAITQQRIKQ